MSKFHLSVEFARKISRIWNYIKSIELSGISVYGFYRNTDSIQNDSIPNSIDQLLVI